MYSWIVDKISTEMKRHKVLTATVMPVVANDFETEFSAITKV